MSRSHPKNLTISAKLVLMQVGHDGGTHEVEADLRYTVSDPYAVSLIVHAKSGVVEKTFARDLLMHPGTSSHESEVNIYPSNDRVRRDVVMISLWPPHKEPYLFEAPADLVECFSRRMTTIVPPGDESLYLNLDKGLEELLRKQ